MQIDPATDIPGLIDIQPTFIPGGELPVADGDAVVPIVNRLLRRFEHAFATQDWHPAGHASFASAHPGRQPYDTIEMSNGHQVLWPDHGIAGTPTAPIHPAIDQTRIEVIVRKVSGHHWIVTRPFSRTTARRRPDWMARSASAAFPAFSFAASPPISYSCIDCYPKCVC
jgi:hypothetical protein